MPDTWPTTSITEEINPVSRALDTFSTLEIVRIIHREDAVVPTAVAIEAQTIAAVADRVAEAIRSGGRVFYIGAGTSGRVAAMDASEWPPTFGTPHEMSQAIVAGGKGALERAVEGAEDDEGAARSAVERKHVSAQDVVIGLTASGMTPFVLAALSKAKDKGACTVLVTANPDAPANLADFVIRTVVGPEVIAGSSRMKAATAAKMVLHTISTAAMVRAGKVHGNLMVALTPTNRKLLARATRLVAHLVPCAEREARALLEKSGWDVKVAALAGHRKIAPEDARGLLARHGGVLRRAMEENGR